MAQDQSSKVNKTKNGQSKSQLKILDKAEVNAYFKGVGSKNQSNKMVSSYYSEKIIDGLQILIMEGDLQILKQEKRVQELLDATVVNQEQARLSQLKSKKQFIQKQLQILKGQTSPVGSSNTPLDEGTGFILSREQHHSLVKKIKKEKQQRQRRHNELLNLMESKSKEKQELQKRLLEQRQREQLQHRREQIQKNLVRHKQEHENLIKIDRESKQKIKDMKKHKFMYQQIEEKYQNQIVYAALEEKKKKLKELRQYKSFSIEQLKEHQKSYLERRKLNQSRQTSKDEWSYQPPPKSERLALILEQQKFDKIKKAEEKKKLLDENLSKQEEYIVYLKQNFIPKIDPHKRQQLQKRMQKQKIVKPEHADQRQIGKAYLEEAKRKRKKIEKGQGRPQTQRNRVNVEAGMTIGSTQSKTRAVTNYLSIDHNNEHYQKRRRENLKKIMKEDLSQADKIKQLKLQADKINQNMKRKQMELKYKKDVKLKEDTLQLLLSSIQAKIGIIEMYN